MTVNLEEAQARLPELIRGLQSGEDLIIALDDRPIARLTKAGLPMVHPRKLGTLRGTVLAIVPDFDAPLEDFREYME